MSVTSPKKSGTSKQLARGTQIWYRCSQLVWRAGQVVDASLTEYTVESLDSGELIKLPLADDLHLRNLDEFSSEGLVVIDDLTQLIHLHEPAILHSLQIRFDTDKIYTFTGPILIALNPFKRIPNLYDHNMLKQYASLVIHNLSPFSTPSSAVSVPGGTTVTTTNGGGATTEGKPHVFAIAATAFQNLLERRRNQTILISGESGAGKTESTKLAMKFLAFVGSSGSTGTNSSSNQGMSSSNGSSNQGSSSDGSKELSVEERILQSNPLLEAFGNARTLRNDNSSRFGKWIEMLFDLGSSSNAGSVVVNEVGGGMAKIIGARIETYLLEKIRVTDQQQGERNFHILYQCCAASSSSGHTGKYRLSSSSGGSGSSVELDMSGFTDHSYFEYLTRSAVITLDAVDDVEEFEATIQAMLAVGMSIEEVNGVLNTLAAILHLGNLDFTPSTTAPDGLIGNSSSNGDRVGIKESKSVSEVIRLLGVNREELEQALTTKLIVTRNEKYYSPLSISGAVEARDALARHLYGQLFKFIVIRTNRSLTGSSGAQGISHSSSNTTSSSTGSNSNIKVIGILDIFGFEQFKKNSFEQLCINYTNERLQQYFNEFVFKLEEQLYQKEGISWDPLDFPDNQDVLDLLQDHRAGLFAMLDEECVLPGGSDKGYCSKAIKKYGPSTGTTGAAVGASGVGGTAVGGAAGAGNGGRFDIVKTRMNECFIVKHFAGPVCYSVEGFLDKNKDTVNTELLRVLGESNKSLVKTLYSNVVVGGGNVLVSGVAKKNTTLSSNFRQQLDTLMTAIGKTDPHFVRCIKPNAQNLADVYERQSVTEQLRYGGVLQAVQVSRAGFPVRMGHEDFWLDFRCILDKKQLEVLWKTSDVKTRVAKLLDSEALNPGTFAVGSSLVFFKHQAFEVVQSRRLAVRNKAAIKLQAKHKAVWEQRRFQATMQGIVRAQAVARGLLARLRLKRLRQSRAAVTLQSLVRGCLVRGEFLRKRRAAVAIQAAFRGRRTRAYVKQYRLHVAATEIQRMWRGSRVRRVWKRLIAGASLAQRLFRTRAARLQLRRLKQEAKEVGSLLVKFNRGQEELLELRRRISELEAGRIHAQQESQTLGKRLQAVTDDFDVERRQLDEKHRREVHNLNEIHAAELKANSVIVTDLNSQVAEFNADLKSIKDERARLTASLEEANKRGDDAEAKYQLLLKSTTGHTMPAAGAATAATTLAPAPRPTGVSKRADVQLVGAHGTGKTRMLVEFIEKFDRSLLPHYADQKNNLIAHYTLTMAGALEANRSVRVIDCNGNARAGRLVRDWFPKTHWVFCVYDVCSPDSLALAQDAALEARAAGAQVLILGNKFELVARLQQADDLEAAATTVDITAVKDFAVTHGCLALETTSLAEALELVVDAIPDEQATGPTASSGAAPSATPSTAPAAASSALDSFKSWLGVGKRSGASGSTGGAVGGGVLVPSLRGSVGLKNSVDKTADGVAKTVLRATNEVQDSESAITCLIFGQEKLHARYILLAAASKDGTVVVYKVLRTEAELGMLSRENIAGASLEEAVAKGGTIEVHSRLIGHTRAITSLFFNLLEDVLVTTSIDKSVRFWSVDTGEMLKVFTDSSPVPVACFLPFNPSVFIAANSNAVLRLVNVQNGQVLQKLKVETEVRALRFDDTGLFLLAGTKNGTIHVLEANDNSSLKFKFKLQIARGGITCITFVPATNSQPAGLLVNSSDSSVTIVDCSYAAGGVLTNLTVRHRVKVAHSLLPLKCCFSPSDGGYLISGSEDKSIYMYSLAKNGNYRLQLLHHHQVPVVSVATNQQDTLLVSADSLGKLVLWRRFDFSHLN